MFLDDIEGASDSRVEQEELPTGVITLLTKCYSSSCDDENPCYSFACPRRVRLSWSFVLLVWVLTCRTVDQREAMSAIPAVEEDNDEERVSTLGPLPVAATNVSSCLG